MTEIPDQVTDADEPDQDASANKVDAAELDDAPTADKDPAEGRDGAEGTNA